jgi:hypothetical protein
VSHDPFSPEDCICSCRPFSLLSVTYFHDCFPDV